MKRGNLFKWTNYLSGWQCRYVVVERGTLSYYRNELDMEFGCRGVIHLGKLLRPFVRNSRFTLNNSNRRFHCKGMMFRDISKKVPKIGQK